MWKEINLEFILNCVLYNQIHLNIRSIQLSLKYEYNFKSRLLILLKFSKIKQFKKKEMLTFSISKSI